MNSKVLVTGGTGFIGSNLVKELVDHDYDVTVFDNNFRGRLRNLGEYIEKVRFIEGDIRDPHNLLEASRDKNALFHLAYINGTEFFYKIPETVLEVGVKGAINTLDAAVKNQIGKYVLASSSEVYQQPTRIPTDETERIIIPDVTNPRFSYSGGKIINELMAIHYARRYGFTAIIFRPHNVYGPDMGYEHIIPEVVMRLKKVSNNFQDKEVDLPIQGTGEETRAFCFVKDAVRGIRMCMEQGRSGEIYNVGTSEEISIKEVVRMISDIFSIKTTIIPGKRREGGTTRRCPDISKLASLGYRPEVSLGDGLRETCLWYAQNTGGAQ